MTATVDQLHEAQHYRSRPFVTLGTYPKLCEACGSINSNHETATGTVRVHHYLCTRCMNDWSEWCDWKRETGLSLSISVWPKWFAEFLKYADTGVAQ